MLIAVRAFARSSGVTAVGLAYCNPTLRTLGACEFEDSESLGLLEACIVQLGAKECVIPREGAAQGGGGKGGKGSKAAKGGEGEEAGAGAAQAAPGGGGVTVEGRRLRDVLARCGVMATERPPAQFTAKDLEADLGKALRLPVAQVRRVRG